MSIQVVVLGAGGHALSVADAAESSGLEVVGFVKGKSDEGHGSIAHPAIELSEVRIDEVLFTLGIGSNQARRRAYFSLVSEYPLAKFATIIHRTAWVSSSAQIGEASVVLSHASIGPQATLGIGGVLNTGSSLDHQSKLGDFGFLGPGARAAGAVTIGDDAFVGINASLVPGITIGNMSVVGAHSLVLADVPDRCKVFGAPATIRSSKPVDEKHRTPNKPWLRWPVSREPDSGNDVRKTAPERN